MSEMKTIKPVQRKLHRVARIAAETDLSVGMVYKLIEQGELQVVRIGRALRVTDESYQRFQKSLGRDAA
ncbi:MAG TPA: hypothetical protein VH639_24385 [Bryobacteraceae bacterium]|jgi:hypothetical protein